jgi:uncharacterized membrane protein
MFRGKLIEKNIGATNDFRWRSHEITRIEGFSDAVFAFAVTLLVVSLEVPKTFSELLETMEEFGAFACGFALLFLIWYNQYKFFRRYGLEDKFTITLSGILLFVVLFFVYPLKFLFAILIKALTGRELGVHLPNGEIIAPILPGQWSMMMTIYGVGYVAIFGVFALLYYHALGKGTMLELNELEKYDTRASMRENILNLGIGLLSIAIVAVGGSKAAAWSGLTYMLVGPVLTIHGMINGKRRRRLETKATS